MSKLITNERNKKKRRDRRKRECVRKSKTERLSEWVKKRWRKAKVGEKKTINVAKGRDRLSERE